MLALEHGEPLDEAVYCEVMFDKTISGEVPEHRDFIYHTAIPKLERMGVKVRVLRAEKTYVDLFTGTVTRGPKKGMLRPFQSAESVMSSGTAKSNRFVGIKRACLPTRCSISASPTMSKNGCHA